MINFERKIERYAQKNPAKTAFMTIAIGYGYLISLAHICKYLGY